MNLFIVDRLGLVHRLEQGVTCAAGYHAPQAVEISALQALVYRLPPCGRPNCFPQADVYERAIGRSR